MTLTFAYNTNGLAHHRFGDAFRLLADLGYRGVALTPDVGGLDPLGDWQPQVQGLATLAAQLGLVLTVESGARYLLDPRVKHAPSLLDADPAGRERRRQLLSTHLEIASALGARGLSIWSGAAPGGETAESGQRPESLEPLWERLVLGLRPLLEQSQRLGVALWFEPEPGMFIERPQGYRELCRRLAVGPEALGLTLDVGHCLCTNDLPVSRIIAEYEAHLCHVHLADIAGREHRHLPFGQGDLDLGDVLGALLRMRFEGLCAVELSRDSHRGPQAAAEALAALRAALPKGVPRA